VSDGIATPALRLQPLSKRENAIATRKIPLFYYYTIIFLLCNDFLAICEKIRKFWEFLFLSLKK